MRAGQGGTMIELGSDPATRTFPPSPPTPDLRMPSHALLRSSPVLRRRHTSSINVSLTSKLTPPDSIPNRPSSRRSRTRHRPSTFARARRVPPRPMRSQLARHTTPERPSIKARAARHKDRPRIQCGGPLPGTRRQPLWPRLVRRSSTAGLTLTSSGRRRSSGATSIAFSAYE